MTLKFEIYTLVDITETRARRGDDPLKYKQQQNYLTVLQTIGMRANPTVYKSPSIVDEYPKFGTAYEKTNRVWKLNFDIEYEDGHNIELLKNDFNLVPFISELNETAKFKDNAFITDDKKHCNIVFVQTDKY